MWNLYPCRAERMFDLRQSKHGLSFLDVLLSGKKNSWCSRAGKAIPVRRNFESACKAHPRFTQTFWIELGRRKWTEDGDRYASRRVGAYWRCLNWQIMLSAQVAVSKVNLNKLENRCTHRWQVGATVVFLVGWWNNTILRTSQPDYTLMWLQRLV